ncbi:MAG TPA: NAD(P)-dependent oxidoreductase [Gaiellales bacterium]|nr:NAD(P)-dependent oxidoreductase [Gaiellales bacterium]
MSEPVAIVGAGPTGLACARALAGRTQVVVVERGPAPAADVRATAIRWDGRTLVAVGPSVVEIAAAALVIATGTRPLSAAELGLTGARPEGVLAAPTACDLAAHGRFRPVRPVVIGGGRWAARAVEALLAAGAEAVTVIAPTGLLVALEPTQRIVLHERLTPLAVRGDGSVERLECDGARFDCDGIVLAHGLVPIRNVDGAVVGGERTVYAQPSVDPPSETSSRAAGVDAARAALAITGGAATIGPWSSSQSSPPSA